MRVLLLHGGGVGNLVHGAPAIEAIRNCGHDLTVWVGGEWDEQAAFVDHDKVVTGNPPDPAGFERIFQTPFALTGKWGHLAETIGKVAESCGARVGQGTTEVDACMWFAHVLGYRGLTPVPKIKHKTHTDACWPFADDAEVPYVVIAPGVQTASAVWLKKKYPHWRDVATALDKHIRVICLGTNADWESSFEGVGENWCGKGSLWDASGVLRYAQLVLGPDNGLTCLAAVMGVPTVVLWGPTDEVKNRKYGPKVANVFSPLGCRPCQYNDMLQSCVHVNCMRAINPRAVLEAARSVWPSHQMAEVCK